MAHAQRWFIPLAQQILLHHNSAKRTVFIGLNGCQGSGKSTLTDFLKEFIQHITPLNVATLSLDDFYLSRSQRRDLSVKIHPLLSTRGVPGTHDTKNIEAVFCSLKKGELVEIPRFDKATDDPKPTSQWTKITDPVDIVIFEGWCWGVQPQTAADLIAPVNDLERLEDELGVWRSYVNTRLTLDYLPLYQYMTYWITLRAPSFKQVLDWRIEQEHKLHQTVAGSSAKKGLMTDKQISRFIQFYQRLTEVALEQNQYPWDWVIKLDNQRNILSSGSIK